MKRILLTLIMLLSFMPALPVSAQTAAPIPAAAQSMTEPRADILEYYYKVVDGISLIQKMRRLSIFMECPRIFDVLGLPIHI